MLPVSEMRGFQRAPRGFIMCEHWPPCPPATAPEHGSARLVAYHPEQGWGLLCNGVVIFDDGGELPPGDRLVSLSRLQAAAPVG
ncbi:hypothetical protein Arub01_53850 [Actinomadura rubrobrunea]|uniref:Uncharacterized protein n=2 Tax=Actinomadura rubrobrunea TaxID=115335 RepID=A0A9W6UZD1_9ACTN|nr:hypothetical protein Arub01_53850 [Actinomadura rubrobrunea]